MSQPISYGSAVTEYTKVADVSALLNMFSTDSVGNYILWDIPITPTMVQAQVDFANVYVSQQIGFISGTIQAFTAHVLATDIAGLRTLVLSTSGWVDASFNYNLGDISVQKGQAAQTAITNQTNMLKTDIDMFLFWLSGHSSIAAANTSPRQFYSQRGSAFIP